MDHYVKRRKLDPAILVSSAGGRGTDAASGAVGDGDGAGDVAAGAGAHSPEMDREEAAGDSSSPAVSRSGCGSNTR